MPPVSPFLPCTPLNKVGAVELLLEYDAPLNVHAHSDGYAPLHCAATASSNARELTEMLLQCGADRHALDRGGRSVAELAALSGHAGVLTDVLVLSRHADGAASAARSAKALMHTLQHAATGLSQLLPSPRTGGCTAAPRAGALPAAMPPLGQLPGMASAKERARAEPNKGGAAHGGGSRPPPSRIGELWARAFGHAKEESRRRASAVASLLSLTRRSSSSQLSTSAADGDSARRRRSAPNLPSATGGGGGAAVRPAEDGRGGSTLPTPLSTLSEDSEPPTSERGRVAVTRCGVDGRGVPLEARGAPGLTHDAVDHGEGAGPALVYV